MKKKYILISIFSLNSFLLAEESCDLSLLSSDDKLNIDGKCSFPISNTNFVARIGYLKNEYDEFNKIHRYVDNDISFDKQNAFGSIYYTFPKIGNTNMLFTVGGRYSYFDLHKIEKLTDKRDNFILETDIDIKIHKFSLTTGIQYLDDYCFFNAKYIYTPKEGTSVEKFTQDSQETPKFENSNGQLDYKPEFESSFLIEANLELFTSKLHKYAPNTIFEYSIGEIPYLYQQKVFNDDETGYIEETQDYDEITQRYGIKLGWTVSGNFMWTVGYTRTETETKDNKTDEIGMIPQNEINVGIRYLW